MDYRIYDSGYRGPCPLEQIEQITMINYVRDYFPNVIHPRNEGKRSYSKAAREKAEGLTPGASDIIIPARVPFVCELKREDRTKSRLTKVQKKYLKICSALGCFACVAYGHHQAIKAFTEWMNICDLAPSLSETKLPEL